MAFVLKLYKSGLSKISNLPKSIQKNYVRCNSSAGASESNRANRGLVLGIYEKEPNDVPKMTSATKRFNDQVNGRLGELIVESRMSGRVGQAKIFNNLDPEFSNVCVVGVGKETDEYDDLEARFENKENIRKACGVAARKLQKLKSTHVHVDAMNFPEQAAEGSVLGTFKFVDFRSDADKKQTVLEMFDSTESDLWARGTKKADAQNCARRLCEMPSNLLTPTKFAQRASEFLCPCGMTVEIRNLDWIISQNLTTILTVARSSCEPPVLLEISYCGAEMSQKPILLVGSGVTFNTGGLFLKNKKGLMEYRATMCGAAVVVATMRAVAELQLPINITALVPLCENMVSGLAIRCGDVVQSQNGNSIIVHDTDKVDVLTMADTFHYGLQTHKPKLLIDIASLTTSIQKAFGGACAGVFSNSHSLWKEMHHAGAITGDRVWRMPLWKYYTHKVTDYTHADVSNLGKGYGYTCLTAAALRKFAPCIDFMHLDIRNVGMNTTSSMNGYLRPHHMTGRPTRTLIQFLYQLACPPSKA